MRAEKIATKPTKLVLDRSELIRVPTTVLDGTGCGFSSEFIQSYVSDGTDGWDGMGWLS